MKPEERIAEYDPCTRYRPYRVHMTTSRPVSQEQIAYAGCETAGGIGGMLETLLAEGEYTATDRVGILDTDNWQRGEPGVWLINPWPKAAAAEARA